MQILPREENIGQTIGTGLSQGLNQLLGTLAQNKLQQYAQRQQATKNAAAFKQMNPGLSDEQAMAYAMSSPDIQQLAFKNMASAPQEEALYNAIRSMMPNQGQGQQMEGMPGGLEQTMQQLAPETMPFQGGMIPGTGMPLQTQMQIPQQFRPQQQVPQQMQQQQGFQMPQNGRMNVQNAKYLTDLMMRRQDQQQKQDLGERKQIANEAKQIQPFLSERAEFLKSSANEAKIAEEMIDIIKKHGGKFPGSVTGSMPRIMQNMWLDDPDIKRYMNLADALVISESKDIKGRPTQYMTKLVEGKKAGLQQPNKTKLKILQDIVDARALEAKKEKYIESTRDPRTGALPLDIQTKASHWDEARENPLDWPQYYKKNWKITNNKTGKSYVRIDKNGKPDWKEL